MDGEVRNHDAAGNTTSIGGKTFIYNDANRMKAVKQGNAVLESYAYNHRGERVLRTPAGGAAQITLYDEAGQWLGNYSATDQAQQQAIWLDNYPVALMNTPATGVPELAYVQPDHLGTPRVVIDPVRNVSIWEWSNKSEVFGNQIPRADPDGDGVAFGLALRFPGQQATDASGLFYNYQREYDPAVGRYSQSDPIGLNAGVSTYGYVISNPTRFTDPLGLTTTLITTYNFGIANHSAIHVSRPGKPDFLYDPSGTYAPGGRRGTGGLFEGRDASLASYKKYQVGTGSRGVFTVIPLTPEQELTLIANAAEWGARGFWCASRVSGALGGMCGIKQTLFPGVLQKSAKAAECPVK